MIKFRVNQVYVQASDSDADMPLLWFLRDHQGLKGTKYGCGIGQCGACTVHLDGQAIRSCSTPLESVHEKDITTIEGLAGDKPLHPVQQAWVEVDVPQCGYCQAGQIMAAAALLEDTKEPTDSDIESRMTNLCRCGMYQRIKKAIKLAARLKNQLPEKANET